MSGAPQRPRLRAKTGCITCKNRRKKCDEARPACQRCKYSGYLCQWPTTEELIDRRYTSHPARRKSNSPSPSQVSIGSNETQLVTSKQQRSAFWIDATVSRPSESAAHQLLVHDLESVIARHFIDRYYGLLLLPSCHPQYYNGWINEIQELMVQHKPLRHSVLACAASHLHFVDESPQMQELSLTYYSQAIRGLSDMLAKISQLENHNGLLMSIMLLYLHGCMGRGTYPDIPRHVNAAIRILKLRLMDQPFTISQPFDRLAVESVLYQIFLVTMGSWSDPFELDYQFDPKFWLRAENLLAQSMLFPGPSITTNSPVLGVPLALFKLALSIKQLWHSPLPHDAEVLDELKVEMEQWEGLIPSNDQDPNCAPYLEELSDDNYPLYRDATYLYILVSSLLVQQLIEQRDSKDDLPEPATPDSWQVKTAIRILRDNQDNEDWSRCYIGNWPVYTLGIFVDNSVDMAIVRRDMERRWNLMRFSQLGRFRTELEMIWARRGFLT
ncbi:hypothetical protein H2200_004356 [Cladophialophora chaetospira]|uniref:Zn(2)-C6 fungal-type domain-containing protein n=1 Tax=Cladophialophora chaetospira TaxID=386627 RepID=A0AA38XCY9_9EURO|nr:hypothetical protein H2200_004356 [Cladophialophora chaetospira]